MGGLSVLLQSVNHHPSPNSPCPSSSLLLTLSQKWSRPSSSVPVRHSLEPLRKAARVCAQRPARTLTLSSSARPSPPLPGDSRRNRSAPRSPAQDEPARHRGWLLFRYPRGNWMLRQALTVPDLDCLRSPLPISSFHAPFSSPCTTSSTPPVSVPSLPSLPSSQPKLNRPLLPVQVACDLSHIDTPAQVVGYLPADGGLEKALKGAKIVVIPAGEHASRVLFPRLGASADQSCRLRLLRLRRPPQAWVSWSLFGSPGRASNRGRGGR